MTRPAPDRDPAVMICVVCRRALDYYSQSQTYRHGYQDLVIQDHEAVPVRAMGSALTPRFRCDFCNADIVSAADMWVVPAHSFGEPGAQAVSVGNWVSCQICAELIITAQWQKIVDRALGEFRAAHPDMRFADLRRYHGALVQLYRQLRGHMIGPPYQPGEETHG